MTQNTIKRYLIRNRAEYIHSMYHWKQHCGMGSNTQHPVAMIQMKAKGTQTLQSIQAWRTEILATQRAIYTKKNEYYFASFWWVRVCTIPLVQSKPQWWRLTYRKFLVPILAEAPSVLTLWDANHFTHSTPCINTFNLHKFKLSETKKKNQLVTS
jgi:hypothetical protein